jgi:hypothetical protein
VTILEWIMGSVFIVLPLAAVAAIILRDIFEDVTR